MNCRRVTSLLSAYIDGELTGVEMLEIRRHLSDCADCEEEHAAILFTKQALSRLGSIVPKEDFVAKLSLSLDEVQITPYQRMLNSISRVMQKRFAPAATVLAVSGFAMVVLSSGGSFDGSIGGNDQYTAEFPISGGYSTASFIPELHTNPEAMASSRPLMVASDVTSVTNARVEFVSTDFHR
jgi:hypothetical protein